MNTYGSPEEGGAFCMPEAFDPAELRLGTAGKPFPGHELRIVDPVTGFPRRTGSMGEVQVRGDGVPRPEVQDAFGSTFTDDGWMRTGDMGSVDAEGRLHYGGRLAEMLTIGGESVSALTIEAVLGAHPAVALAQVIGRPDPDLGEVAMAFVELRPGAEASEDSLAEFCRARLPQAHVPRAFAFVTDWPTSASKILKPALAEMADAAALLH
jgi:acyl-CoA synthetase (AMP-forming)/AMP-acid ligase II